MWLFVMFDLPVKTSEDRKNYARFRKLLLESGFSMLQLSVYARPMASEQMGDSYARMVKDHLPPAGYVRLLMVTDRQFGKMKSFIGPKSLPIEEAPRQLELF